MGILWTSTIDYFNWKLWTSTGSSTGRSRPWKPDIVIDKNMLANPPLGGDFLTKISVSLFLKK